MYNGCCTAPVDARAPVKVIYRTSVDVDAGSDVFQLIGVT